MCFASGRLDTKQEDIKAKDVIHPLGVMRGVVRGVRDYGNRMGIPTVNGAIQFDDTFIYNPLVFCGTAGVIPIKDIAKEVKPGHLLIAPVVARARRPQGRDVYLGGARRPDSHEEDQTAVQIGNPIEEKKVADFVLAAREAGLIEFITDCGAGGFSSAAGEMLSDVGGEVWLENCPLKEPGLESWQVFISESQERMVMAIEETNLPALQKLADIYQSEMFRLGESRRLEAPQGSASRRDRLRSACGETPRRATPRDAAKWNQPAATTPAVTVRPESWTQALKALLSDFAIVSREPIIREYDHEVQGNTVLKPLAGASGDAPQDGAVIRVDGSDQLVALACALLPEWGKHDPYAMGRACVDECVRQLVAMGANPERIAILDNFCVGNPDNERELGALVECIKGLAEAALAYGAPFVSGKDSFYNYFVTDEGPVSIPTTLLVSGFGIVEDAKHVVGASLRRVGSKICILGKTTPGLRGSVFARHASGTGLNAAPTWSETETWSDYQKYHDLVKQGAVLSCHDISEGGLAIALAEMAFSGKAGLKVELENLAAKGCTLAEIMFGETPGRLLLEVAPEHLEAARKAGCIVIGETTGERWLHIAFRNGTLIDSNISDLKPLWQNGLTPFY